MALDYSSDKVTNEKYLPSAAPHSAREIYTVTSKVTLDDQVDTNDMIGLAILPANCIPVDCALYSTDLGTDEILVDVGILNTAEDDLVPSSLLVDGSEICRAGGLARMDDYECVFAPATWLAEATCPDLSAEKTVALKVMTKATTPASGTLYFKLDYRAAENGV
jgi:hypothetical protein